MKPGTVARLNIPIERQRQNPICWLVCAAMAMQHRRRRTIEDDELAFGGAKFREPMSIANVSTAQQYLNHLRRLGFSIVRVSSASPRPIPGEWTIPSGPNVLDKPFFREDRQSNVVRIVVQYITNGKPIIFSHYCGSFSYGAGVRTPNTGAHAVLITGIDTSKGIIFFNNPWGQKDVQTSIRSVEGAVQRWEINSGLPSFAIPNF